MRDRRSALDTEPIPRLDTRVNGIRYGEVSKYKSGNEPDSSEPDSRWKVGAAVRFSLTAGRAANSGLEPRHFLNLFRKLERAASCITRHLLLVFGRSK